MIIISRLLASFLLLLATPLPAATAWIAPTTLIIGSPYRSSGAFTSTQLYADSNNNSSNNNNNNNPFAFLFNPYESKIPDDLRDEIYAAEARTPAAQERGVRVATYAIIAFVGIVLAFFNAFVTELRNTTLPEGVDPGTDPLAVAGFTWVYSNVLLSFLFTNKLGGGLSLLLGAGSGLMAEAELDTKRLNAEKIFQEMERRRLDKGKSNGKQQQQQQQQRKGRKRRPGKEQKRMQALSEIVDVDEPKTTVVAAEGKAQESVVITTSDKSNQEQEQQQQQQQQPQQQEDGILGKIKGFYDKADQMAASQALLLNKELEDKGFVEKITDETGLKVVGREKAAQLKQEQTTAKVERDERSDER